MCDLVAGVVALISAFVKSARVKGPLSVDDRRVKAGVARAEERCVHGFGRLVSALICCWQIL